MVLTTIQNTDKNLIYTNTNFTAEGDNIIYDETSNNESFNDITTNNITVLNRSKEESNYNNSYYATIREALPVIKNNQFITDMMNSFTNPYTVAGANVKQWCAMGYSETLDRLVAFSIAGVDTTYVYSNDGGINWISGTLLNATFNRCKWITDTTNGSRFFALHAGGNNCRFSSDALSWTAISSITTGNQRDIIYLPSYNRYVMCNSTGNPSILVNSTPSNLALNWGTTGVVNQPDTALISMAYSPELNILVAVGSGGASRLWTSSDGGLTWVNRNITGNTLRAVVWAKELSLFIAIGDSGSILYSSDGINWSNTGTNLNNKTWTDLIWIPDLHIFVAGNSSASGNELAYSYDGRIWITQDIAGDDFTLLNPSLNYISKHGAIAFCSTTSIAGTNRSRFFITRLANRIPTGYNTFGHPFNQISDLGNWYVKEGANYVQFTAGTTTYSPSARAYRYHCLELNDVAHATNATFNIPAMADGDAVIVQCYCGANTSSGRQIILNNQTGFPIWNAKTMTPINSGATGVIFQAVGMISNTSYLFVKAQGGSVNMIELGDKMGQTQPGPIILSGGSQASPSLTFSGDTDTGLFWQSNGEFKVSCNNTLNQTISQSVNSLNVPLSLINGGASSPSLRFQDSDTGFFSVGNDAINFTSAGVERMYIFQDTVGFVGSSTQVRLQNGTSARPSLSFSSDTGMGLYFSSGNLNLSTAGVERLSLNNLRAQFAHHIHQIDGSKAAPSYSFTSDNDSGMYRSTGEVRISTDNTDCFGFRAASNYSYVPLITQTIILAPTINNNITVDQTLTRSNILTSHTWLYSATNGARTITLPSDLTADDVGLVLKIGRIGGSQNIIVSAGTNQFLNNIQGGTITISTNKYIEIIMFKLTSGVEEWIATE